MLEIGYGIKKLLSMWRWWILPALLALLLAICFQDPFAGEWDSLDYSTYAITGWQPSSMFLGRILFIFSNRVAYLIAHDVCGLQAQDAYLLFKYMVIMETPLTIVAMWALARELSGSARSATLSALILALSPYFIFLSGQAMTEIPSILVMCAALTIHLRGLRRRSTALVILGAMILGLGVNIREGVGLFGIWLALAPLVCGWNLKLRDLQLTATACSAFLICALGPFALWFGLNVGGYRDWWWGWVEASRREAALVPMTLETVRLVFLCFFRCSPLALLLSPYALWKEWRERGKTPLFLMGALGFSANAFLIVHYSAIFHGRYFLTGLPAMAPLVADCLIRTFDQLWVLLGRGQSVSRGLRASFFAAMTFILVVEIGAMALAWPAQQFHRVWSLRWKNYRSRLEELPHQNVVLMTNSMTNAVGYWSAATGAKRYVIGCGTGWPGDDKLVETVGDYLRQGKKVFIDADPRIWDARSRETRALPQLQNHFRFREITYTIYEICPQDDLSAVDDPELETLSRHSRQKWSGKIP